MGILLIASGNKKLCVEREVTAVKVMIESVNGHDIGAFGYVALRVVECLLQPDCLMVNCQVVVGLIAGSDFDQLNISSLATLDGVLNITLIGGYIPNLGDSFVIMTFTSRSGEFAIVNGVDIGGGLQFAVIYGNTNVTLDVVSAP